MSVMAEYKTRPEQVGNILVKVQEDLVNLKERLHVQAERHGNLDLSALEAAIHKTELGLQEHTEQISHQVNNRVNTLRVAGPGPGATGSQTWDILPERTKGHAQTLQSDTKGMSRRPVATNHMMAMVKQQAPPARARGSQIQGLTPGEKHKDRWSMRVMQNPQNEQTREVLDDHYSIQLPLIVDKKNQKPSSAKVHTGSTIDHLAVLPKSHRVDASLVPPQISENQARQGILSLIQRGLIPPAAELTLDPAPVGHKQVALHDPTNKERDKQNVIAEGPYHFAGVRFDETAPEERYAFMAAEAVSGSPPVEKKPRNLAHRRIPQKLEPVQTKTFEMKFQPLPPPTTPASGDFKSNNFRFPIQHGKVRELSPEFMAYKQNYCLCWGSIVTMLKHLEKLLTNYAVPIAFVNGDRLADLAMEFELDSQRPSVDDLLSVLVNKDDVIAIVKRPGQRYMGPFGKEQAATKIQSTFRRYVTRKWYLEHRRLKWASGVIAITWVMNVKMSQVRKQLKYTRQANMETFRTRSKKFAANWNRIKNSRRVVIHVPSLGYAQHIRESIGDFGIRQNTQFARLCDLRDPNVDVIYVSPVPINDETLQYYAKLVGLKTAVDSSDVAKQSTDIQERYKIIVPEAVKSFPTHRMCLATHLKYSPRALRRIKAIIKGKDAYIVPGMTHLDDIDVAAILGVPILSGEPDVMSLYSSHSGSKRIFASANISTPPSEYDVYSIGQVYESLAQLVTENLDVRTWLFKLDDEFDGRGIAFCHVTDHLRCHVWVVKESQRYGDKWNKKWAQEPAFLKIQHEIPEILQQYAEPCNKSIYPSWQLFLEAFLSKGGVIEACPPSESVTALKVDMLIEPSGKISILTAGDQIHAESPFACWGVSTPQSSVEPDDLNKACVKVAEACKARGVIGHFTIDFVTFIDPKTDEQVLWAVDLSLSYSDTAAMNQLIHFVTNAKWDGRSHELTIDPPRQERTGRRRRKAESQTQSDLNTNLNRYAVLSTRLLNSNLAVIHYSVFFQMCRAHGIGYDIKEKQGTMFTLIDSFNRENLGMVTIGDNLQGALSTFARNLSVLHQEFSTTNMQGNTNFLAAIEDIEAILGTTLTNEEEEIAETEN